MAKKGRVTTMTDKTDDDVITKEVEGPKHTAEIITIREGRAQRIFFRDGNEVGAEDVSPE